MVSTSQPLSVVENQEFRDLLPREFQPPCRKTFTNVCLDTCYQETKKKLLYDLESHASKYIGVQLDHTSASNYDPYCSLCIQYINDDFSLRSISVGTILYTGRHTAEALYEFCEGKDGLVEKWNLQEFNRVYTTDSFSSNVAGFKDLETIDWVPCMAHFIHNTVKHGLTKCLDVKSLHSKNAPYIRILP